MWNAKYSTAFGDESNREIRLDDRDDRELAWRVDHSDLHRLLPMKFGRQQDAERAAEIMNERCPCEPGEEVGEVRAKMIMEFHDMETLLQHLVENCCAW